MLIRYKKTYEKIAMGLLSFMPNEKTVKILVNTIKEYETNDDNHLFLWKLDDIVGIIGIQLLPDKVILIKHLSVNPSFRNQGIATSLYDAIRSQYTDYTIVTTQDIASFIEHCHTSLKVL
ncbi:GNAT family N-acetyltransferase [Bacillus sp. AFS017336]|uniref:GNAT family N-acetyltransferase n=1 Tax=Bacillus sp. AFS017336 TaxID=2033489 RepID=UPI000BEF774C|nr:GNAT family N-acetyltransferase [Bacillus sp. AFS017336]PEK98131.1 N-acetyltransferase [Bacillus sp. AFS017336]